MNDSVCDLRLCQHHESGHAVAALLLRMPVERISARLEDGARHATGLMSHGDGVVERYSKKLWHDLSAAVGVCGPLSELYFFRSTVLPAEEATHFDLQEARQFMGKETVDFRRAERYAKTVTGTYDQRAKFQGLLHSAWRTITHAAVWQQITSLADALETYGELSGAALVPWKREAQRIARRYDLTLALRK